MPAKKLLASAPIALALFTAACGSTSKTPTTPARSAAAPSSSTPASASPYGYGSSSPSSTSTNSAALITTKQNSKLGPILAYGPKKLTVYLFAADRGGTPSCSGACAQVWPPVIGTPKASGGASASDLGTVKTSEGKLQVTYKGHPLYLYVKDADAGDAYGQRVTSFGAPWFALTPSGQKVNQS